MPGPHHRRRPGQAGTWEADDELDLSHCRSLERLALSLSLTARVRRAAALICAPPGCRTAAAVLQQHLVPAPPEWLAALRPDALCLYSAVERPAGGPLLARGLAGLRHVSLLFTRFHAGARALDLAAFFRALPPRVETLAISHPRVGLPGAACDVPAGLTALRIKAVDGWVRAQRDAASAADPDADAGGMQPVRGPTLRLHGRLARLCLLLWDVAVALEWAGGGAPVGLVRLNVQAAAVALDARLAAEVAARGRLLGACDAADAAWQQFPVTSGGAALPRLQARPGPALPCHPARAPCLSAAAGSRTRAAPMPLKSVRPDHVHCGLHRSVRDLLWRCMGCTRSEAACAQRDKVGGRQSYAFCLDGAQAQESARVCVPSCEAGGGIMGAPARAPRGRPPRAGGPHRPRPGAAGAPVRARRAGLALRVRRLLRLPRAQRVPGGLAAPDPAATLRQTLPQVCACGACCACLGPSAFRAA